MEDEYTKWRRSKETGSLWIQAIPGAGKSVAAAHLISEISATDDGLVLYFFFRQIISTNRTPDSLVRDWMAQLLGYSPHLQERLALYLEKNRQLDTIAFDELWDGLVAALRHIPQVICVADALDEMSLGHDHFIKKLIELGCVAPAAIKVFMTSRPIPRIQNILKSLTVPKIIFGREMVDKDMDRYLKYRLLNSELPQSVHQDVQSTILNKSQGLFLYARIMMDDLLKSDNLIVQETLDGLPNGLSEMYTMILHEHAIRSNVPQWLQVVILQWVTSSARPLRLLELATVIDLLFSQGRLNFAETEWKGDKSAKAIVRDACGPLLEIMEDETVSIIHHSFTEYLMNTDRSSHASNDSRSPFFFPVIDRSDSHRQLGTTCTMYLSSDWASEWSYRPEKRHRWPESAPPKEVAIVYAKYPLLRYASRFWSHHLRESRQMDPALLTSLTEFVDIESRAFTSWVELSNFENCNSDNQLLHILSREGLAPLVEYFLRQGHDVNAEDASKQTPLHLAATRGHKDVVGVLLDHGANMDPDDESGFKPLHLAAMGDHASVISALIGAGVDPMTPKTRENPGRWCGNAPSTIGHTPVTYAFEYGHVNAAMAFLPHLDAKKLHRTLIAAGRAGKTNVISATLNKVEVDVNGISDQKTLFYITSYNHDYELMQNLLQRGADISIKSDGNFSRDATIFRTPEFDERSDLRSTALHAFVLGCNNRSSLSQTPSTCKSEKALKLLLAAGCDLEAIDKDENTALHLILLGEALPGHDPSPEIVAKLLQYGANVHAINRHGLQPILMSCKNAKNIRLLIAHGAQVNARNMRDGQTCLFKALEHWDSEAAETLVEHGADCTFQDNSGDSPLHVLLRSWNVSVEKIRLLLKGGANPNVKNDKGFMPLHGVASSSKMKDSILLLSQHGANFDARTPTGRSVIMTYLTRLNSFSDPDDIKDTLRIMQKAGGQMNSQDFHGSTVLHYLSNGQDLALDLPTLVSLGADIRAIDFEGNSILHYAARVMPSYSPSRSKSTLESILEMGVEPSVKNNSGQTPFHIASGSQEAYSSTQGLDPFETLLSPKYNPTVDLPDNKGVCPIHLAASVSESRLRRLVESGADLERVTSEELSALHVAARARQSNIVGLLTQFYVSQGRTSFIDHVDNTGRTALHYACRSGMFESVAILLDGGANPNIKDKLQMTAIDMCSEFHEEDHLWRLSLDREEKLSFMDAASYTLDDLRRPRVQMQHAKRRSALDRIETDQQTVGIRRTTSLLLSRGADVTPSPPEASQYDSFLSLTLRII